MEPVMEKYNIVMEDKVIKIIMEMIDIVLKQKGLQAKNAVDLVIESLNNKKLMEENNG